MWCFIYQALFYLGFEIPLFEAVGAFLFQLRAVQSRLSGGIGSNINVCQCYQGYSVAGLSMPLLKVSVNEMISLLGKYLSANKT